MTGEVRKYYGNGEQRIASSGAQPVAYFYTRDHLGSVRELVDSTGAIHSQTDYDPFGKVSQQHGPLPDFAFTGHYFHEPWPCMEMAWRVSELTLSVHAACEAKKFMDQVYEFFTGKGL